MYKVFFNDSFLIFTNKENGHILGLHSFQFQSLNQVEKWLLEAESSLEPINLICICSNPKEVWVNTIEKLKIIEAAGGLIQNNKNEYLLIFRRGKWDLPKGKIDKGELKEQAAIREVREETGIKSIEIISSLSTTYHVYRLKNKLVLKKTFWFLMHHDGNDKLYPQGEEDIEKALWLPQNEIQKLMPNMFGSIHSLFSDHVFI